jgi:hypothetical protein
MFRTLGRLILKRKQLVLLTVLASPTLLVKDVKKKIIGSIKRGENFVFINFPAFQHTTAHSNGNWVRVVSVHFTSRNKNLKQAWIRQKNTLHQIVAAEKKR